MIKISTLLLIILSTVLAGYAQKEFAPVGAEWYYKRDLSYAPPHVGYAHAISVKDTLIMEKSVRIVEIWHRDADMEDEEYLKTVYFHQNGDTVFTYFNNDFHVLYNFSVSKGDTLSSYSGEYHPSSDLNIGEHVVTDTMTVDVGGVKLRAYTVDRVENSVWIFRDNKIIEQLGSIYYLFPTFYDDDIYDAGTFANGLLCYSDSAISYVNPSHDKPCDYTYKYIDTGVNAPQFREIKLFPTKAENQVTIECTMPFLGAEYQITDMMGRNLGCGTLSTTQNVIDVSTFSSGLFIVTVANDSGTLENLFFER